MSLELPLRLLANCRAGRVDVRFAHGHEKFRPTLNEERPAPTPHAGKCAMIHNSCSTVRMSAARSPITTQGAIVFPVVTRGMIDASAMRRLRGSPCTCEPAIHDQHGMVQTHLCGTTHVMGEARRGIADEFFERPSPFRLPGMTPRLTNGRSGAEFPISRQSSSTQAIAVLRSSGSDSVFASIRTGSARAPTRQAHAAAAPRGCATAPNNVQPADRQLESI